VERIRQHQDELPQYRTWMPPGHFYSPIPSIEEVKLREGRIFLDNLAEIPAISLNQQAQVDLLNKFKDYYGACPFNTLRRDNLRYVSENPNFSPDDAVLLYCMIRHLRPRKIIEVGSGYSSCVTLDTNELFFDNAISCTFIEPYPQLLRSLIKDSDQDRIEIIGANLQDIELDTFSALSVGDILFIDSTHVSKTGSDVNYILFDVLPHVQSGVYIHFHDVYYPFEYPKEWVYEGRAWNEAYLLRAFLQYNDAYQIVLWNNYLAKLHGDQFANVMPGLEHAGGSIWLKKL